MGVFNIHGKWTKINNLNKQPTLHSTKGKKITFIFATSHPTGMWLLLLACATVITVIKYVCVSDKTDIM